MKNLLENGTRCLIVQSEFSEFGFWNYVDVCKITGAKYPAAPLGLLTVAALLPQQWEFKLVDANVEPLLFEHFEWADIVCLGGMLPQQKSMISIIHKAHQYGCSVVVGGPDPSSQPNLYQSADYLVQGEGEVTIPMFIQDLEKGCKSGEYKSVDRADMTKAVVPRFDLIRFQDYIQVGIQYSRGCPFNCEFCDIIELYGRKSRTKTQEQVIKELQTLYDLGHRGHIDFVDDNFIGNKKNVRKVLPVIREWSQANKYPFYFSTEASINLASDENLLQMMKDVDFRYVFVGIETPEDEVLKLTNKKINVNVPIVEAVNKIYSYGMIVNGGFIIGFDNETDQTAEKMIQYIQDSGICMAMVGKLYALPETQLTKRLHREGRLFENASTLKDNNTDLDQMTSGLNFITSRPRLDVLKDYIQVIKQIYNPERYYERITYTCLNLKPANKFKPGIFKMLKSIKALFKVCLKVGFNKTTGLLYWKTIWKVISRNPKGIEAAVNLAAMFIHFYKQSKFIVDLTNDEIRNIESCGEEKYYQSIFQENENSSSHEKSLKTMINR
ncbi:MAG: B12-binding domain-containing radical SAM protein [Ignavibacteriae bacterium]|nr:MAG: B12-binding domain-containing radical SAM protein [Ignavibacteriota bacterium]